MTADVTFGGFMNEDTGQPIFKFWPGGIFKKVPSFRRLYAICTGGASIDIKAQCHCIVDTDHMWLLLLSEKGYLNGSSGSDATIDTVRLDS